MPELQQISSVQFTNQIPLDLEKIQPYCGEPIAAIYADNLLRMMQSIRTLNETVSAKKDL